MANLKFDIHIGVVKDEERRRDTKGEGRYLY